MSQSDRELIFGKRQKSEFFWCLHCERTYKKDEWRTMNGLQMCPYPGCGGDAVLDAWPWEHLRSYHPHYPSIPIPGVVYPAYPKESSAPGIEATASQ